MDLQKIQSMIMKINLDSGLYYIPEILNKYVEGKIILNPDFQRKYVWDKNQKSHFIESILLGIPTPSIFVFEDSDLKWQVIDGQQRISTILEFYNKLAIIGTKSIATGLTKTTILGKEFEGKTINDFDSSLAKYFSKTKLHVFILKKNSNEDIKYRLFERLNKMGTNLTSQEIRNSYLVGYSREFYDLLTNCSSNLSFKNIARITDSTVSSAKDKEYILKNLSLLKFGNLVRSYKSGNDFLDQNLGKTIEEYKINISDTENMLIYIFEKLDEIFGKSAFISSTKNSFVIPIYDTIMYGAMKNFSSFSTLSNSDIETEILNLRNNSIFQGKIGVGPTGVEKLYTATMTGESLFI